MTTFPSPPTSTAYICAECGSHGTLAGVRRVAAVHECRVCDSPVNVYGGKLEPVWVAPVRAQRRPYVTAGTDVLQNKAVAYVCDSPAEAKAICEAANRHWHEFDSEHETYEDLVAFAPELERFREQPTHP